MDNNAVANKVDTNQREKASRDEGPGARDANCTRAFSPAGIKRYPQRAVALPSRTMPSTRRTTSNASKHETTNGCHEA